MRILVTGADTVRTNIVLDSKLVEAGLKATELKTRREWVDFALRELLRHKQQQKILSLKGKVTWEGDLEEMRTGRGQRFWSIPVSGAISSRAEIYRMSPSWRKLSSKTKTLLYPALFSQISSKE
jgi:Arc/MetJ family transcription regulator